MAPQTLDQRRAVHAYKRVEKIKEQGEAKAKEYGREAKKLPVRIMAAGLGQALAFLRAKARDKKPALKYLLDDLTDWVLRKRPLAGKDSNDLLKSVIQGDADFLRQATDETLAYLRWLNRFLEAEFGSKLGEQDDES